mgnify:CR=1 FL=1
MIKLKLISLLILVGFAVLFLHNAWLYSPLGGYDAGIHSIYTKIITFEKRIPTPKDTPESYNPPTFYYLSGQLAKVFTPVFNNDFLKALKSWQILIALLLPLAGYLWYDIYRILNPENKYFALFFLFWFLSLPVVNKMAPMYNLETPQLILSSFIIWWFIKFVLKKPSIRQMIYLGIFCGVILSLRIMSASLILSLGLMVFILFWTRRMSFKKMLAYGLTFTLVTLLIGGQYYYFYRDKGVFDSGENVAENSKIPFFQRQPKSFYTDTFFRTSMRTPIRPYFPNRFIPIFYSTFWGDYWNYYRQRRFPLSAEEIIKFAESTNKVKISAARLKLLAWQNRINLIPTLILVAGMATAVIKTIKQFSRRRLLDHRELSEGFLAIFFVVAFLAFFYTNIQFPNIYKGDTIKASYILYSIPALIYFASKFLQSIQKQKYLFYSLIMIVIVSFFFNLNFSFY